MAPLDIYNEALSRYQADLAVDSEQSDPFPMEGGIELKRMSTERQEMLDLKAAWSQPNISGTEMATAFNDYLKKVVFFPHSFASHCLSVLRERLSNQTLECLLKILLENNSLIPHTCQKTWFWSRAMSQLASRPTEQALVLWKEILLLAEQSLAMRQEIYGTPPWIKSGLESLRVLAGAIHPSIFIFIQDLLSFCEKFSEAITALAAPGRGFPHAIENAVRVGNVEALKLLLNCTERFHQLMDRFLTIDDDHLLAILRSQSITNCFSLESIKILLNFIAKNPPALQFVVSNNRYWSDIIGNLLNNRLVERNAKGPALNALLNFSTNYPKLMNALGPYISRIIRRCFWDSTNNNFFTAVFKLIPEFSAYKAATFSSEKLSTIKDLCALEETNQSLSVPEDTLLAALHKINNNINQRRGCFNSKEDLQYFLGLIMVRLLEMNKIPALSFEALTPCHLIYWFSTFLSYVSPEVLMDYLALKNRGVMDDIAHIANKLSENNVGLPENLLYLSIKQNEVLCKNLSDHFVRETLLGCRAGFFDLAPHIASFQTGERSRQEYRVGEMVVLIQNGKEKFNNRREADVYFLYKRLLKVGFSDSMAVRIMISDNQALRCCKSHYFCLLGTQFESLYDGLKSFGGEKKSEHIEAESMASEPTLTHKGYR